MPLATSEYQSKNAAGEFVPFVLSLHTPERDPLSEQGDYRWLEFLFSSASGCAF
jgi:hypothetical protein